MPKIVVIGNSAAGFSCCDTLAKLSSSNEITVISKDKFLPYRKDNLLEYISGSIAEHALYLVPKDYYSVEKIDYKPEQEVSKLDTKKQRVILKDNTKINYDFLIIASGLQCELPDIPGTSKDGVVGFCGLEEAKTIVEKLLVVNLVCCVGKAEFCLKLAKVFLDKGKEVKAIISDVYVDPISHEKLEIISNAQPVEIIGEGAELKAVKLSNGKVIGTSMIVFASQFLPSSEFLKESDIYTENGFIVVDDCMKTSIDNVFACGAVAVNPASANKVKDWIDSSREGWIIGTNLIGMIERRENIYQKS